VRVQLVLPEKCDHRIVDQAMRSYYDRLLDAGCELWVRPPPFLHAKLLVVDGLWAMVGSANLDTRSFRLNYELNLALVGADAVGKVAGAFEEERRACRKLDAAEWRRRGPLQRAWSSFCALWSPLL
jgi:cardiolipin synthase